MTDFFLVLGIILMVVVIVLAAYRTFKYSDHGRRRHIAQQYSVPVAV
jgi:hypothetical protein